MMVRRIFHFVMLLAVAGASALSAASVSSTLKVIPQSKVISEKTIHKVTWTTITPINRRGKIAVIYPNAFTLDPTQLVMATTVDPQTMNGALQIDSIRTINISGSAHRKVIMTRKEGGSANQNGEGAVGINLALIGNAAAAGTYKVRLETFTQDADPFTSIPSDSGSTLVNITEPISDFSISSAVNEPKAGEGFTVNVTNARDADGNLADGVINISFETGSVNDHVAPDGSTKPVLTPIWVTNGSGSATQTLYKVETIKLRGTASGGASRLTGNIFVKPGMTGSLTLSKPPETTVAGTDFGVGNNITVTAFDAWKNRKTDLVGNLYFDSSDPKAQLDWNINRPFQFTVSDGGVKTFSGEEFEFRTAGYHTFDAVFPSAGIRQTSERFEVLPGVIKSFAFETVGTQTAGSSFELKVVNAVDDFGNPANATITVNFTGGDHNAPNGLIPNLNSIKVNKGSGGAFQTLVRAETLQLIGQASSTVSALTNNITVQPAALSHFKFSGVPATVQTNANFTGSVTLTAYDGFDNKKTNFTNNVTFGSSDTNPQVVLPPPGPLTNGSKSYPGSNFKLITLGDQYIWAYYGTVRDSTKAIRVTGINNIRILSVTADDSTVSRGQSGLVVKMQVSNNSPDPYENFTASLNFRSGTFNVNGDYTTTPQTGSIPAASTIMLTFNVNVAANATLGSITLDGQIIGTHKGVTAQAPNAELQDAWTVQHQANVSIAGIAVSADTVSRGSGGIPVILTLRNNQGVLGTADAQVIKVTFKFQDDQFTDVSTAFSVSTDPNQPNPVIVPGAGTTNLNYVLASQAGAPLGKITVSAQVEYQDVNIKLPKPATGNPTDFFQSVDAPSLQIVNITPSQLTATQGQTKPFTVAVGVRNISASPVTINLAPAKTYIRFIKSGQEYISPGDVTWPSGPITIPAGQTGTMTFTVNRVSAGAPTGNYTILARVESSDGYFNTSDLSGVYGALEVQSADDVVFKRVYPSQLSATVNDNHPWNIVVELINRGGSDVTIDLAQVQAGLTDAGGQPVTGFTFDAAFLRGDVLLTAGESDELIIPVTRTGAPRGTITINPTIHYTVNNTNVTKSKSAGDAKSSILLQNPAALAVTRITSDRVEISAGKTTAWDVRVSVENSGEAELALDLADADSTWLRFYVGASPSPSFSVIKPTALIASGSTKLAGGARDSLLFKVTANSPSANVFDIKAAVKAVELNRNKLFYQENTKSSGLRAVTPANISYQPNSLGPLQAIPGRSVEFQLTVVNSGQAAVTLNPNATTFSFSDGVNTFLTSLDETRGALVPGAGSVRLYFQQKYVSTVFISGSYVPTVTLSGVENGVDYQKTMTLTGSNVIVGQPGSMSLDSIVPSTQTVTVGQSNPWYIDLTVTNSSGQTLKLKSANLIFSAGTQNVTSQFALQVPNVFDDGQPYLKTANTGKLRATINSVAAGVPIGDVLLSAQIALSDSLDSGPLFEQQLNNAAKVTVQSPAVLEVTALTASQSTVTRGQAEPWLVKAQVRNDGGSALTLITDPNLTFLSFSKGDQNFSVQPPTAFIGSGSAQLAGNSSDSLTFRIIRVDDAESMLGPTTLTANLALREINTGRVLTDNSPAISVTIQDPARVRLDSLQAMISSAGLVNAGQEFYLRAKLTNTGGSTADHVKETRVRIFSDNPAFALPDGSIVAVDDLPPNASKWTPPIKVNAPAASGQQGFFRATIASATARNTNGPAFIVRPGADSTEVVTTQTPANFQLVEIKTDQDTVTSSASIPWSVTVTVRNTGEGIIELLDPKPSDIQVFSESGNQETDYIIEPQGIPAGMMRIGNGASVTLTYIVRETGKGVGRKTVRANISGLDLNNLGGGPKVVTGNVTVFVTTSSFVRLIATSVDTANYNVGIDGIGHVNVGQEFVVRVQVRNEGGRYLESVKVGLTAPNSQVLTPEREITRLAIAGTGETTFLVKASDVENLTGETLNARIIEARGFDGAQAAIKEAVDPTAIIKIYRPAQLRISATENLAPNPLRHVSLGQAFDVRVTVKNEGSEAAGAVLISLAPVPTNLVVVERTPLYVPTEIKGGDSANLVFRVQAGSAPGAVTLTSAILSAKGLNSRADLTILPAGTADTTTAFLYPGADLEIVQVKGSAETVNAGDRLSPWNIFAVVRNNGGADLEFVSVADSNITFSVGGIVDRDYKILPPDGLEKAKNFVLQAGTTDTLVYTVRRNGDLAGEAVYTVFLRAFDRNSRGDLKLSAVGTGTVYVANNAALQIRETRAIAKAEDENKAALVNRGQEFDLNVRVQTGQFGGVVNVVVQLQSSGNTLRQAVYDTIKSIGSDSVGTAVFRLRADDSWDAAERERSETFTAKIISAMAKGDLTPVAPREPARGADEAKVRIQHPAELSYRLQLGEFGGTWVEKNKKFTVIARMRNRGTAAMGVGRVQLTPPNGYTVEREPNNFIPDPVEKTFSMDLGKDSVDVRFTLRAPDIVSGPDRITATLTELPPDKNSGAPVLLGDIRDFVDVRTDSAASLSIESFVIDAPQGAVDGVLSTEQVVVLKAVVLSRQSIAARKATLSLPSVSVDPAYQLRSPQVIPITAEAETLKWELTAPLYAVADPHTFELSVTGGNIADTLYIDKKTLTVERLQQRTTLALEPIEIIPSGVIREGIANFTQGQEATIVTRVRNFGEANYVGTGRLTLDLSRSGGLVLIDGDAPTKPFGDDAEISWRVKAPATVDPNKRSIMVRISEIPQDVNSNVPARVTTVERELSCYINRGGSAVIEDVRLRTIFGDAISAVSTEQQFQVAALISTYGVKDAEIKASLRVTSEEFQILDAVKFMPSSGERMLQTWTLVAPNRIPSVPDSCYVVVEAIDLQSEAKVTARSSRKALPLTPRTQFNVEPQITFPAGLVVQDKLSTDQIFHLTAVIKHSGASFNENDQFRLRLSAPVGFRLLEGETATKTLPARDFKDGVHPTWRLQAPPTASDILARFSLFVEALPRDMNTGLPSKTDKDEVLFPVRTVKKAEVKLRVYVHDDPENDSTSVRPGSLFRITSRLQNFGDAQLIGSYRLHLKVPPIFELINRDTTKTAVRDTLSWLLRAPRSVTTVPDTFTVRLLDLPLDEFARTPVKLIDDDSSATAQVWVENGKVIVKTYPVRKQTAVVRGAVDVPMIGLILQNKETSASTRSFVTGLHLSIRDKLGNRISGKPMIKRIAAVKAAEQNILFGQAITMNDSGRVFLNFRSIVMDTLIGNRADSIKLIVDIHEQAEPVDFRITIDSTSALPIVDQFNLPLSLVDSTGTVLNYLGISSPIAVLIDGNLTQSFYNYPNPFGRSSKPSTQFIYYLREDSDVQVSIYTLTGDLVRSWEIKKDDYPEMTTAGLHQGDLKWDGTNGLGMPVLSGVYLAYIKTGYGEQAVTKIAVVR